MGNATLAIPSCAHAVDLALSPALVLENRPLHSAERPRDARRWPDHEHTRPRRLSASRSGRSRCTAHSRFTPRTSARTTTSSTSDANLSIACMRVSHTKQGMHATVTPISQSPAARRSAGSQRSQ